jgi:hypothetical protein
MKQAGFFTFSEHLLRETGATVKVIIIPRTITEIISG